MAGRQDYEERKQNKIDRLENAAINARNGSASAFDRGHNLVKDIPLGQPNIRGALTGVMNKSRNAMDTSFKLADKANYLESRLNAVENNTAISSDDPNSIEKLQEKVNTLKDRQSYMKRLNAFYKKNGTCKGFENMTDEETLKADAAIKKHYSWEQRPFPSYELTSVNGKIKAAEDRINQIKAVEEMPAEKILYEGVCEITSDADINRCVIQFFNAIPDELVSKLKSNGFKWAYTEKQWQRLRNRHSWFLTKRIAEEYVTSLKL